ncbi:MAG: hypothetical protein IPP51_18030, partial [Bacteroidetes bacterium]|nr:hypothetical protein [Bacteroidota bacterium]
MKDVVGNKPVLVTQILYISNRKLTGIKPYFVFFCFDTGVFCDDTYLKMIIEAVLHLSTIGSMYVFHHIVWYVRPWKSQFHLEMIA